MTEQNRQRTIRLKLSRMADRLPAGALPSGFALLDRSLGGGGLPRGAIVELFGPAACGKTTLAIQFVAAVQRRASTAAWIDAEHTFDPSYAASLGVMLDGLPVVQPDSAEQALEIARRLVLSAAVDLIVVDSAAALVPRLELASAVGDAGPGLHARVLASGLRHVSRAVRSSTACVLFLNQTRMRRDPSGEDAETTAGGAPLKLHAAVRIALSPVAPRSMRFRIVKNRAAEAFTGGALEWRQGAGFTETP